MLKKINIDEKNKKERIIWLDIIRTGAIILVVFCHAIEAIYQMDVKEWYSLTTIVSV